MNSFVGGERVGLVWPAGLGKVPGGLNLTTVETAYKVYIFPRGNLLYMQIYLITDLKLLLRGILGL